eukprot:TRINITY_DN25666_c0_g1_i1.p1 TRINITY_DN25666_c0_g1~~TRINITY_DN25666_c0_g1_i1.p1  ORF type:complete len:321 (+),score=60.80 TRINITY_DN25666_c0_g1_i1:78-965(+)
MGNRVKRAKTETATTLYPEWSSFHGELCELIEKWMNGHMEQNISEVHLISIPVSERGECLKGCENHHMDWLIENDTNYDVTLRIADNRRMCLPQKSAMLWSDISLWDALHRYTYKVIVIDPPWPSHSVRRSNSYQTLQLSDIKGINLSTMAITNTVVAVWVTNSIKVIQCALECLSEWNVEIDHLIVWLKYSDNNQLVCPLNSTHRKPYEICIVGTKSVSDAVRPSLSQLLQRPIKIIKSPRDAHSRKPFLGDYLTSICKCDDPTSRSLELFARTIYPNWVCAGNEVPAFNEILE